MNPGIFKACDLRGKYPTELDETTFRQLGQALATLTGGADTLVGGDGRGSTPALRAALIAGLQAGGARVLDAGMAPTPVLYFGKAHHGVPALAIVTASHNPASDNGLKLMLGDDPITPEQVQELRVVATAGPPRTGAGTVTPLDLAPAYRAWLELEFDEARRPLRVVCDAGGGAYSDLAPTVFRRLGYAVEPLFCTLDPMLTCRDPNSAIPAGVAACAAKVREVGAALGVAFDGDGDRVACVDEQGVVVSADDLMQVLLEDFGARLDGEAVVYDLKTSMAVAETVTRLGGTPLMEKSGHAFIKARMLRERAVFGGEVSGHYFYRQLHGGDDGLYTALRVAQIVARTPLSTLVAARPHYAITPDVRLPFAGEPAALLARLRAAYPAERVGLVDGVRIAFPRGWALARASITERKVTLRFEGRDVAARDAIVAEICGHLPELAAGIRAAVGVR